MVSGGVRKRKIWVKHVSDCMNIEHSFEKGKTQAREDVAMCMCMCAWAYVYVFMNICLHECTCVHMYVYVCITCVCMHVCVCTCVCWRCGKVEVSLGHVELEESV